MNKGKFKGGGETVVYEHGYSAAARNSPASRPSPLFPCYWIHDSWLLSTVNLLSVPFCFCLEWGSQQVPSLNLQRSIVSSVKWGYQRWPPQKLGSKGVTHWHFPVWSWSVLSTITGRSGTWKHVRKAKLILLPALLYGLGTSEVAFNTQAKAGCGLVKGKNEWEKEREGGRERRDLEQSSINGKLSKFPQAN